MEDAFTRQHAQYLLAAVLAVGARVVGRAIEHARTRPPFVDLHALGVKPSHVTTAALQRAAKSAVRQSLAEEAHAVQLTPIGDGYRVRVLLAPQRPPLQPYEITDLQVAWERAQARELGPTRPTLDASREVATRQQELDTALAGIRDVHTRLVAGHPELQPELADAMNRAQIATDALRAAVQRANPLRPDRRTFSDTLAFVVRTEGMDGLSLVERDRAIRDTFARAAGLSDPAELRVTTRPTRDTGESIVRVAFNVRNTAERGPEHLNVDSLREAILAGATAVPSVPVKAGAAAVNVAVQAIETYRAEMRGPAVEATPELQAPTPVRETTPVTRPR